MPHPIFIATGATIAWSSTFLWTLRSVVPGKRRWVTRLFLWGLLTFWDGVAGDLGWLNMDGSIATPILSQAGYLLALGAVAMFLKDRKPVVASRD